MVSHRKKLLIYKILLAAFAFVIAFMPATASRDFEVNSRVIVEMLGLDGDEDGVEVTAQYVTPAQSKDSSTKDYVTVKAKTLVEAVESLNSALGRKAELGHCSVVVAGSELDTDVLGTLLTATDVTADVYLTGAEDKASELVKDMTEFMKKTGITDADFIAYSVETSNVATTTLLNFLSDLGSASKTAFMPVITMIEEKNGSGSGADPGSGGGDKQSNDGQGDKKQKTGMKADMLALYNTKGRAILLDSRTARGVAWVSAPGDRGAVVCDVEYDGKTVKDVSARIEKKRSEILLDAPNNSATVKISATVKANGEKFNIVKADKDTTDAVRAAFASEIEKDILSAFELSRAVACDPLFIGREFFRYEPDYFAAEYLPEIIRLQCDISVDVK